MRFIFLSIFIWMSFSPYGFAAVNDARKANEAFEEGDYVQAEILYKAAIEEDADNFKLYFNLGNSLAKQGKVEEALAAFLESEELAENRADKAQAQYNMGTLLAEKEQWQPASLHFRNSLRLDPSDLDSKNNFEIVSKKANEEEEKNQQNEQNEEEQESEPPTEYAKAMKAQAERLVNERKYSPALKLMNDALKVDKTVSNFNDFIERIKNVDEINNN